MLEDVISFNSVLAISFVVRMQRRWLSGRKRHCRFRKCGYPLIAKLPSQLFDSLWLLARVLGTLVTLRHRYKEYVLDFDLACEACEL